MKFEHLKRREITVKELYPSFKEIINRTRTLNPRLAVLLDNVEEFWSHGEIELAAETLLDYVTEDDKLSDTYDIGIKERIRLEILISDVVKTFVILNYLGSKRHSWEEIEVLFYE